MSVESRNRLFQTLICSVSVALSAVMVPVRSAQAQGVPNRLPPPAALTQPTVAAVVNQVLRSLERVSFGPFAIDGSFSGSRGLQLFSLSAQARARFSQNVSIALQAPSGNAQLDAVIPVVTLQMQGLEASFEARTTQTQSVSIQVRLNKPGTQDGAVATVRSQNMDLLALQLRRIDLTVAGLQEQSGRFEVQTDACDLQTRLVDFQTGRSEMRPTSCRFSGFYAKDGSDYEIRFSLDSAGTPAPAPR